MGYLLRSLTEEPEHAERSGYASRVEELIEEQPDGRLLIGGNLKVKPGTRMFTILEYLRPRAGEPIDAAELYEAVGNNPSMQVAKSQLAQLLEQKDSGLIITSTPGRGAKVIFGLECDRDSLERRLEKLKKHQPSRAHYIREISEETNGEHVVAILEPTPEELEMHEVPYWQREGLSIASDPPRYFHPGSAYIRVHDYLREREEHVIGLEKICRGLGLTPHTVYESARTLSDLLKQADSDEAIIVKGGIERAYLGYCQVDRKQSLAQRLAYAHKTGKHL